MCQQQVLDLSTVGLVPSHGRTIRNICCFSSHITWFVTLTLDIQIHLYKWGGMKLQKVKLMDFRAMFFSPTGGYSFRMKGDVSSWSHHSFDYLLTVKGTQGCAQRYTCLVDTPIQSKESHTKAELSFTDNLFTWVMVISACLRTPTTCQGHLKSLHTALSLAMGAFSCHLKQMI